MSQFADGRIIVALASGLAMAVTGCAPATQEHAAMQASSWATAIAPGADASQPPAQPSLGLGSATAARPAFRPFDPLRKGGGYHKIGNPYEIAGTMYHPRHDPHYEETGTASWYGDAFHAKTTANGEVYDMDALTAAHRTLPLPSLVMVTNLANGKSLLVRVNDRGPFKKGRIIDLSRRVAEILDFKHLGTTEVRVKYVGPAPLDGDDSRERAQLASQGR